MLNLEDFMNIRDLKQQGWSVSAIAAQLDLDRKTVRKHLVEAPQGYKINGRTLRPARSIRTAASCGNDGKPASTTPANC
jgi:transposase